jgi:hypothetical protein
MSERTPPGGTERGSDHWSHFDDGSTDELVPALELKFGPRWGGAWIENEEPMPTIGIGLVGLTAEDVVWAEARSRQSGWAVPPEVLVVQVRLGARHVAA